MEAVWEIVVGIVIGLVIIIVLVLLVSGPAKASSGTENLSPDTDTDKDVDNPTTETEQIKTSVPSMMDDTINTSTITQSVLFDGSVIKLNLPTEIQKKEYITLEVFDSAEIAKHINELATQGFTVTTMTQDSVNYTVIMERDTVNKTNS